MSLIVCKTCADPGQFQSSPGSPQPLQAATSLTRRYHSVGLRCRKVPCSTPGHCSHSVGKPPGATNSMRADGVPHTVHGGYHHGLRLSEYLALLRSLPLAGASPWIVPRQRTGLDFYLQYDARPSGGLPAAAQRPSEHA